MTRIPRIRRCRRYRRYLIKTSVLSVRPVACFLRHEVRSQHYGLFCFSKAASAAVAAALRRGQPRGNSGCSSRPRAGHNVLLDSPRVSSGDWSLPANWGGTLLPTSNDTAYIVNGGTATITSIGPTCYTLSLGSTAGAGTLQVSGGSLSAVYDEYIAYAGTAAFTQAGGVNSLIGDSISGAQVFVGYNSVRVGPIPRPRVC